MTERERLIELIRTASHELTTRCVGDCGDCADKIADYLLANGVIVFPCKVGDKVYYNKAEIDETCPATVIGLYYNFYTPSMPLWIKIEYQSELIGRQEEKMTSDVFKLLCHYNEEEAEQALKGGAEQCEI